MIPLVDTHCHLLAGLDDGPPTADDALAMCEIAYEDGVRMTAALAHQNDHYPAVTPDRIRTAAHELAQSLAARDLPLMTFACAEVMAHPELESSWRRGALLSMADRNQYLLLEQPHQMFVDLANAIDGLRRAGVRPILAHAERSPELLHTPGLIEEWIAAGCLVQVSSSSVTQPASVHDTRALKGWFRRGIVHVLGSDGHSPTRRPPGIAAAYHEICRWAGHLVADRVCSTNGMAILNGLPLRVPRPQAVGSIWVPRFWRTWWSRGAPEAV
jgi:protein-tyrosine phosphatase